MSEMSARFHQKLKLKNFTAFGDVELEFVPGVNVFIGENGAGKTHLLKVLYAAQLSWANADPFESFEGIFLDRMDSLVRIGTEERNVGSVSGLIGGKSWAFGMRWNGHPTSWTVPEPAIEKTPTPIFIPATDMMGHTRGFVQTWDNYRIDFDLTYREIVSLLLSPEVRKLPEELQSMISELESSLGGSVVLDGERFYLKSDRGSLAMPSVAEGLRKIATLVRLIQCGWLKPGATLFWDEPEVNLNPILMERVVGAILGLARSGVQVFLATHSYVILKELEVQSSMDDEVRFFALAPTEAGTQISSASTYLDLHPNKIEQQYGDLYDRRIKKLSRIGRAS